MHRSSGPGTSVIIAVCTARPHLGERLESIVGQTSGAERMEVIWKSSRPTTARRTAAAPSSTATPPGTPGIRVPHRANPGAGGPRNRALDLARGRYVFFADAEDHLGPEALERLPATAGTHDSDLVLTKATSAAGAPIAPSTGLLPARAPVRPGRRRAPEPDRTARRPRSSPPTRAAPPSSRHHPCPPATATSASKRSSESPRRAA
ncbi:hypothetical protein GCM10010347_30610 [Streptomyces cirratus]|uniref:Glycosyltransferase 2-like domain-containing protein n=1 Tax=Streptomyces cirratus TaxID=68187 RepID=A0ABQ3ESQ9_9ACTN|nr:glycosyltransferase [Streptomyces cirratus]GHB58274.1 hypothetical protein GCM10010347_30610 [Streptomyces cirratus]